MFILYLTYLINTFYLPPHHFSTQERGKRTSRAISPRDGYIFKSAQSANVTGGSYMGFRKCKN